MADKTMKNIAKNKYVKIRRIRYTFIVVARNFRDCITNIRFQSYVKYIQIFFVIIRLLYFDSK